MTLPTTPQDRIAWVIETLWANGTSLAQLARESGVTGNALSGALRRPSVRLEEVIAAAVGVPVTVLFWERFDAGGARTCNVRPSNIIANVARRRVQRRDAA
jgi:lambda repressor-like predicted transcriptional regulator